MQHILIAVICRSNKCTHQHMTDVWLLNSWPQPPCPWYSTVVLHTPFAADHVEYIFFLLISLSFFFLFRSNLFPIFTSFLKMVLFHIWFFSLWLLELSFLAANWKLFNARFYFPFWIIEYQILLGLMCWYLMENKLFYNYFVIHNMGWCLFILLFTIFDEHVITKILGIYDTFNCR